MIAYYVLVFLAALGVGFLAGTTLGLLRRREAERITQARAAKQAEVERWSA